MRLDVLTIFPDYLRVLDLSLIGKAAGSGALDLHVHDLRDHAHDRHRTVDDTPLGGGAGMVMKPDIWGAALDAVLGPDLPAGAAEPSSPAEDVSSPQRATTPGDLPGGVGRRRRRVLVIPTPSGDTFTQRTAEDLAGAAQIVFACGRYEGIDARVAQYYATRRTDPVEVRELSIGDYVLNGGEVATLVMIEAIARLLPGVLGNPNSLVEESHGMAGLLEYPVFTRPTTWRGLAVDPTLLSGDHARIARLRRDQSLARTAARRPDMIAALDPAGVDGADRDTLARLGWAVLPGGGPVRLTIRPAGPADIPALVALARATFPDACPSFLTEDQITAHMDAQLTPERFRTWLTDPRCVVVLAELPGGRPSHDEVRRAEGPEGATPSHTGAAAGPVGYAVVLTEAPGADGSAGPAGLDPRPDAVDAADGALVAELSKVYALTTVRGSGIAAALVEVAAQAARDKGVDLLWLGTHKDNKRAQKAYKRAGFTRVGHRSYDVGGQLCHDVVMARPLDRP